MLLRVGYGNAEIVLSEYYRLSLSIPFFLSIYVVLNLYKIGEYLLHEELKVIFCANSFCCLTLGTLSFLFRNAEIYSRAVFLLFWILSTLFVFCFRRWVSSQKRIKDFFAFPAVILDQKTCSALTSLEPIDSDSTFIKPQHVLCKDISNNEHVPWDTCTKYTSSCFVMGYPQNAHEMNIFQKANKFFGKVLLVTKFSENFGVRKIGGSSFVEFRQKLLDSRRQMFKRVADLALLLLLLPVAAFVMTIVSILVKLDGGPLFYFQERIGKNGKPFLLIKFRTMRVGADALLNEYLKANPSLEEEWSKNQKLKHDPRITPVGKLLRMTSLDELPQLLNIFKGDLSLVGPRPIVKDEIGRYGNRYSLYKKVRPGLTGLWQVSGRSSTTYARRVDLDSFYIINWSLWLDIFILLKTPVALFRLSESC